MAIPIEVNRQTFVIPQAGDPCDLWRAYFDQLKQDVGVENARTIWLITWGENGRTACTTDAAFNAFLEKNRIDVSSATSRAIADISAIGDNLFGLGKRMTKVLSAALPVTMVGVLLVILVVLFRAAQKAKASDLALLHPAGRTALALNAQPGKR